MTYVLYSKIGYRIKSKRIEKGMSQDEMALRLGVDRTYLANVEIGKQNMSFIAYIRICKVLGISINELFGLKI